MSYCDINTILAKYEPGIKCNPVACKRWTCPECSPKRRARLYFQALKGNPDTFITLTSNPAVGTGPNHRARLLKEAWTRTHRKAKKLHDNQSLPFIAIFEKTKSGEPHLHILSRCNWIDQAWLSQEMKAQIDAPVVDIRRINSRKKAAGYVSKYIAKDPEKFEGTKRYWSTHSYQLGKEEPYTDPLGKREWSDFQRGTPEEVAEAMSKKFYRIERFSWQGGEELWLMDDFPDWSKKDADPPQTSLWVADRPPQELVSGGGGI